MDDIEQFLGQKVYSEETRDRYRRAIRLLKDKLGDRLSQLDPCSFRAWLNSYGWGSSTQCVAYNAVRGYLRWRFGEAHPALVLRIKRAECGPQRTLKAGQVMQLLASFDTLSLKGIRDLALCTLMLDTGLRASEICRLELRYLDLEERYLTVIIKGGRWGEGVYSEDTARYLDDWLKIRAKVAMPETKNVFVSVGGNVPGRPLTRSGLGIIVRHWGLVAKIGALSPHDFRRTFATLSTRRGAPQRVLQVAGRWQNAQMVERYTRDIQASDFEPYFPVSGLMR